MNFWICLCFVCCVNVFLGVSVWKWCALTNIWNGKIIENSNIVFVVVVVASYLSVQHTENFIGLFASPANRSIRCEAMDFELFLFAMNNDEIRLGFFFTFLLFSNQWQGWMVKKWNEICLSENNLWNSLGSNFIIAGFRLLVWCQIDWDQWYLNRKLGWFFFLHTGSTPQNQIVKTERFC